MRVNRGKIEGMKTLEQKTMTPSEKGGDANEGLPREAEDVGG